MNALSQAIEESNKALSKEDWQAVIDSLTDYKDCPKAEVHYNLALAHAQLSQPESAQAHIHQAALLRPRLNPKPLENLTLENPPGFPGTISWVSQNATAMEAQILTAVLALGFLLSLALKKKDNPGMQPISVILLVLALFSATGLALRTIHSSKDWAVVSKPQTQLRIRPLPTFKPFGNIWAGEKVEVLESQGKWSKIAAKQDLSGWVATENLFKLSDTLKRKANGQAHCN